jgi:hypothetical protein
VVLKEFTTEDTEDTEKKEEDFEQEEAEVAELDESHLFCCLFSAISVTSC